mgnify:CR=1 FL=1
MSLNEYNELFETKYLSRTDNIFEAINLWANDSEKLRAQYQNRLDSNEVLSASLTRKLPENLDRRILVKDADQRYVDKYIREALTQIDDESIRISVLQTLNHSRSENHLVFRYLENLTCGERSRVRVISRLIWYNLYPKEGK